MSQSRTRLDSPLVGAVICLLLILLHFPGLLSGHMPGPFATTQTDVVFTFEPYKLSTIFGWSQSEAFWWNDKASLGSPLVLPLGVGVLHPFHLFNLFAPAPFAYALGLCARLFVFLYFSYLYLKALGVTSWIALAAALGLSFGNWNINYAQQIIGYTMCFFPMALWAIERFAQQSRTRHLLLLFCALAMMLFGAFPSMLMYAWIVLATYVIVRVPTLKAKLLCGLPFAFASLLCAPMLLETVNFYSSVQVDMEQRKKLFNYVPPITTVLTFILPSLHGGFAEHFPIYGQRDFFGTKLGAGLLIAPALSLFLVAPRKRDLLNQRLFLFWATCLLLCFALYFNILGIRSVVAHIPLVKDHPLTRLQAFIAISGAVVAALALQHTFTVPTTQSRRWLTSIAPPVMLAVFFLFILRIESTRYSQLFSLLTVALCASLALFRFGWKTTGSLASVLLVITSSVYSTSIYVDRYRSESFYPVSPLISEIQKKLVPGGRVLDVNNSLFNMRHAAYGIPSITGHYFTPKVAREMIQTLGVNPGFNGLSYSTVTHFDHVHAWSLLRRLHVQFVVLPDDQARLLPSEATLDYRVELRDGTLTLIEVLDHGQPIGEPDGFKGEGYHAFTQSFGRVRFRPTSNHVVELPIRMYPGWRVTQGGHLVSPGPLGLVKIQPIGQGIVHLEYRPKLLWELHQILGD